MVEDFKLLAKLQDVDKRIYSHVQSKKDFPVEVDRLEKELEKAQTDVDNIKKRLDSQSEKRQKISEDITGAKEALQNSEGRLNSIKTNKEYDAVHTEIDAHRNTISSGMTKQEELNRDAETLEKKLEAFQAVLEEKKKGNQPRIDELKDKISSVDSNIAEVEKEREGITSKVTPAVLRTYEYIHNRRSGSSAIGIVTSEKKVCSVCYKMLEPQLYNEVRKADKLKTCEGCGSILIWHEAITENAG